MGKLSCPFWCLTQFRNIRGPKAQSLVLEGFGVEDFYAKIYDMLVLSSMLAA